MDSYTFLWLCLIQYALINIICISFTLKLDDILYDDCNPGTNNNLIAGCSKPR